MGRVIASRVVRMTAYRSSFHAKIADRIPVAARPGRTRGTATLQKNWVRV